MIVPRTLFAKLLLLFLGFGALMVGVLLFAMRISHEHYHLEAAQTINRHLAQEYVDARLLGERAVSAAALTDSLHRIAAINPNIDLYVLDADGVILGASVPVSRIVRSRINPAPIQQFLSPHAVLPVLGDDPTHGRYRAAFSAAQLATPGTRAAYLYVVLEPHEEAAAAARLKTLYALGEDAGVVLAAILAAIAASVVFLRVLTRRLARLQDDMQHFRASRFIALPAASRARDEGASDEIERLRALFMELAERIGEQMRELQSNDEMRRELIANLSHDLRTPLATLQAHLETLAAKELAAEERSAYLAVSLQQCRRLGELLARMLELAKLDARQMTCSPEPFQLAELVQDVILENTLAARRAGVTVSLTVPSEGVPLVWGDVALIERVVDHVLENAVEHARSGGCSVTARLSCKADAVRVGIHDSGPGIPEGERTRVFERFYRGDRSRSSATGHAGLGLSIARGILELHGSAIDFVSSPTEGTTFFFELPLAASSRPAPQQILPSRVGAG